MGAGLALGREGPTVQMGAGAGHFLATAFGRNQDDVKAPLATPRRSPNTLSLSA
jgi:CIC family chloride channel protein